MATLAELWRTFGPVLQLVGPPPDAAADRPIGWVRLLRARVPALEALEAGDLVIVPSTALATVAPQPADRVALVAELVRIGPAALLVVAGETPLAAAAGEDMAAAARSAGIVVLRAPSQNVAFLERSVLGFLVNRRAEIERQTAALEVDLQQQALAGAELDRLVGVVARFLRRGVLIEGSSGDILAMHAPPGAVGAAGAVSAYLAGRGQVALRVVLPAVPASDGPRGVTGGPPARTRARSPAARSGPEAIVILGPDPAGELERVALQRVATLFALQLARDAAVRQAKETARRSEPLPTLGPPWVAILARQTAAGASDLATRDARERTRAELRLLAPARRMSLRGDIDSLEIRLIAATTPDDPLGLVLGARVGAYLGRPIGLSVPFRSPGERAAAEAAARITLEAVEVLSTPPVIGRADRLALYRLLGGLHNIPDGSGLARTILAPLLDGGSRSRRQLATLRVLLATSSLTEAATVLGVHRNTITYRVRALEARAAYDMLDPDYRLALSIALRILDAERGIGSQD